MAPKVSSIGSYSSPFWAGFSSVEKLLTAWNILQIDTLVKNKRSLFQFQNTTENGARFNLAQILTISPIDFIPVHLYKL